MRKMHKTKARKPDKAGHQAAVEGAVGLLAREKQIGDLAAGELEAGELEAGELAAGELVAGARADRGVGAGGAVAGGAQQLGVAEAGGRGATAVEEEAGGQEAEVGLAAAKTLLRMEPRTLRP